ncbi:3-hydroxyadipyl-CoA dehydrogenase [bacterium HR39]|nr:3-hydroxyadipyl-CoA dehydrogenase [bacterium HR39]
MGEGFYRYRDGEMERPPRPPVPDVRAERVWVAPGPYRPRLERLVAGLGARVVRDVRPPRDALVLLAPVGRDLTHEALALDVDPERAVGIDPLFGLDSHRTLMTCPATDPHWRDLAHGLFAADGVPASVVRDSPGFVCQRVVATIVNIACEIAQLRIARPADIDRAVVLGLNYPKGPLAWGDGLGPQVVLEILEGLQRLTGDPRYRPSLWLRRRARLGLSLLAED